MTIGLYLGDITKFRADAIVNAANRFLKGGGGVDGAIHRAAGPDLSAACWSIPPDNDGVRCRPGQTVATPGFDLPAKYVLHTVGPFFDPENVDVCDEILRSCYLTSLRLARSLNARSIVFPSISTGVYRFPLERAARIVADVFRSFQDDEDFDEIAMVAFAERDFDVYLAAFEAAIDPERLRVA